MKKGIIITIILVVIAVILAIVFVNLFKERDTVELSNKVVEVSQEGYLDTSDEEGNYQIVMDYLDSVLTNEDLSEAYRFEMENFKNVYETYTVLGEFYSKQIIYTDYNDVYKNNKKDVMNGFDNSSSNIQSMVSFINENFSTVEDSHYWASRTWENVRSSAINVVKESNRAFVALQKIYEGCVTSRLANNDFSTLVLSSINTHLEEAATNFSTSTDSVFVAKTMTNAYLSGDYEKIMNYNYDEELQNKVKDIIENEESEFLAELENGTI